MWTNVFRIGGLQHVSWFQFLPSESDPNTLPEKSSIAEQKDSTTLLVLSAHLQLQNDGFLSTWTNSFVGPWDPSQGIHNPDEKIKLWLFLPGHHSSVVETAQSAVSRLRVVGAGLWSAPGDSEEVATALSQALRNCIERALRGLSYMRFGDAFTGTQSCQRSEKHFRKMQPAFEFIFAATEEAIYVHAIIYAKHIRTLSSDDLERVLRQRIANKFGERLPVIVAPHGMRATLTGGCPSDLVKQVYLSKLNNNASNGFSVLGIPFHSSAQSSSCRLRGQACYVEVSLGCANSNFHTGKNELKQGLAEGAPVTRTFIYPAEAVLVPLIHQTFARSSLKRLWLQNWVGSSLFELWPLLNFSNSNPFMHSSSLGFGNNGNSHSNGIKRQRSYNSSSNSNSSSISSISSTSSDSEYGPGMGTGDLEADADSLTSRRSGLSTIDQFENDSHKMASKRPRTGGTESFGQAGTVMSGTLQEYNSVEGNNSGTTKGVNNQFGYRHWDWIDDDRGMAVDIQILLSEFGDFGDFFEDDVLDFGEPPGTAESQAAMFTVTDIGDVSGSSPCTVAMDVSDPMLLPALGFPAFDGFNQPPPMATEEPTCTTQEITMDARSSSYSAALPSGEFDHLIKAEAIMTFAPEYTAVETPVGEFSFSIFRSPYLPKPRKTDTSQSICNLYVYGVTPPSPHFEVADEKMDNISEKVKVASKRQELSSLQLQKYYTHVHSGKKQLDRGTGIAGNNGVASIKGEKLSSPTSGFNSSSAVMSLQKTKTENTVEGHFLLSLKTVLAIEVECTMFQVAMCRIRHMPLPCSNAGSTRMRGINRSTILDPSPYDTATKYEMKKKENIPIRIAGDVDGGILDGGAFNTPVGVWRSVGVPKGSVLANSPSIDSSQALAHNVFSDEGVATYGQRQHLQDLLDAMPLLVQQSTSFIDVSLDSEHGDGPFNWLALQEQRRRGFSCGPSMVHAGCGGLLASCHSLDIAGVELPDLFSADVHPSSVISLLQSDIKVALKSAFGNLDGPLSVTDWCKGRSQSVDAAGIAGDGYALESSVSETKETSSTVTLVGEPISPPQSSVTGSSCFKDGARQDERRSNQECSSESDQMSCSYRRPTLMLLPTPSILVGYQDDWLKTSANTLQLWEKAPLEPYALPKPMTYCVVCPEIDSLTSAASDFFQQLGTVYETCKLGSHSPLIIGGQTEAASGKWLLSGFVLVDCPQTLKTTNSKPSHMGSISDFLITLSKGLDMRRYLNSLSKVLKALKLSLNSTVNQKEGCSGPCTVIYVICPCPDPVAVLQTLIESSAALGSTILSSEKERSLLHSQIGKALSSSAAADETSISNILTLSGFTVPKLVLQIVTVEAIFGVNRPTMNELTLLKEIAFTVYNKARRVPRASSSDMAQSSGVLGRPLSALMHMGSPMPGLWKDCVTSRITGSSGDMDAGLRPGTWDNAWQVSRTGVLNCDSNRTGDFSYQEVRYLFEPLFVLAESGSVDHGVSVSNLMSESSSSRPLADDNSGSHMSSSSTTANADMGTSSLLDGSELDGSASSNQKIPSLHCCYGWTEDWHWLVCIWTDSRGELLDSHIFPFGGISSRQDTKGLQSLFVQVLHQGCQILACSFPDSGTIKPRDIVITRIGCFYELECQEWQKAIYSVGGNEVKKWPLQLRRSVPLGVPSSCNGTSLQQQEMSLIQERTLPSSPSPSLYSPHSKSPSFMKGGLGQSNPRKAGGQTTVDSSRGLFQWVQSISLVGVSIDHSLHLIFPADFSHLGGGTQGGGSINSFNYLEGFSPVKSVGSTPVSYVLIPSPSMRYLPPTPLQLPTCLTAESPPLAHLLHSKGSAIPLSTGFVVSKSVPSVRRDSTNDEWPSVLSVSLVDYYGGSSMGPQEKIVRGNNTKQGRNTSSETRDHETDTHLILETVAAELHALSWMTVSPAYLERRTALPFHCDMVLRLRRLLQYADKEFSQSTESKSCLRNLEKTS